MLIAFVCLQNQSNGLLQWQQSYLCTEKTTKDAIRLPGFDGREPQKRLEVQTVFTAGLQQHSLCWLITKTQTIVKLSLAI